MRDEPKPLTEEELDRVDDFPARLRIVMCAGRRAQVVTLAARPLRMTGGWLRRGPFLYAWVVANQERPVRGPVLG